MTDLFYKLGRKIGESIIKGKTYYKYLLGSDKEAVGAEYLIGSRIAGKIIKDNKIQKNKQDNRLINQIGGNLTARLKNKYYRFKFTIIESSDINAFAVPGGFIFITSALFEKIKHKPDEIAFVFAHEIMHIILKHPLKKIMSDYSAKAMGNLINKSGSMGMILNQIVTNLFTSTYSRDKEIEADLRALHLMKSAGYELKGAQQLLLKLDNQTGKKSEYNYFASHPPINKRVENVDKESSNIYKSIK